MLKCLCIIYVRALRRENKYQLVAYFEQHDALVIVNIDAYFVNMDDTATSEG